MQLETLESRRHLSATVSQGYPGVYFVDGTAGDDDITVYVDQDNYMFTVDNVYYVDAMTVIVNGYGGNDTISVTNFNNPGYISVNVDGGDGDDTLSIAVDGGVWGGAGDDTITLLDSYRGEAHGGADDDSIYISGACVDAEIRGDDGNDLIDCSAATVGVAVHGGYGADTIIGSNYDDQLFGDDGADSIVGNAGNDEIYADSGDTVIGGDGFDYLHTGGNSSGITHDCESVS